MNLESSRFRSVFRLSRYRLVLCGSAACIAAISGTASAEVRWHSGFENGDLGEWTTTLNRNTGARDNITVVSDPVHSGSHAAKLMIHPDDLWPNGHNRVELHQDVATTTEGGTSFFSWFFKIPEPAKQHEDIGYWESDGSYRQTMAFFVEPDAAGMRLAFRTNLPNSQQHFSGPLSADVWHQLAMQVLWSTDAQLGKVSVWLDGGLVVDKVSAQTKPDQNPVFIQVGYHRDATKPDVETIYIDDAVDGTTLDDVLQVPVPTGGSGGAAAAGAGGGGGAGGAAAGTSATAGGAGGGGAGVGQAGNPSASMAGAAGSGPPTPGGSSAAAGAAGANASAAPSNAAGDGGCRLAPPVNPIHGLPWAALLVFALRGRRVTRDYRS